MGVWVNTLFVPTTNSRQGSNLQPLASEAEGERTHKRMTLHQGVVGSMQAIEPATYGFVGHCQEINHDGGCKFIDRKNARRLRWGRPRFQYAHPRLALGPQTQMGPNGRRSSDGLSDADS